MKLADDPDLSLDMDEADEQQFAMPAKDPAQKNYYTSVGKQAAAAHQQANDAAQKGAAAQQLQQQIWQTQQQLLLAGRQSPPKGSQVLGVPGLAASGFDMDTVMNLVVGTVKRLRSDEQGGKGEKKKSKQGVDDNDSEEELTPAEFDLAKVEDDDGVAAICWEIRNKLRPYTGDWGTFWKNQPRVVRPLRESLDTDFLRMDSVNSTVTLRDHDRGAIRTIKQYSKANIRVAKSKAFFSNVGLETHDVGLVKDYEECTATYQIISALWQYATNVWMIRRDDWSGFLMLRILHDVKFFLPLLIHKIPDKATRDLRQVEVVRWFCDQVLEENSMRGRSRRPPLEYDEVRRVANSAANSIYAGSGVGMGWDFDVGACQFDPYTAGAVIQGGGGGNGGGGAGGGGAGHGHGGGHGGGYGGGIDKRKKKKTSAVGAGAGAPGGGGQLGGGGGQQGVRAGAGGLGVGGVPPGGRIQLCRDWNKGPCLYLANCRWFIGCFAVLCIIWRGGLMLDFICFSSGSVTSAAVSCRAAASVPKTIRPSTTDCWATCSIDIYSPDVSLCIGP